MKPVACTLFESNYHFGVAALVNSLYKEGFRGDFYAGYKGKLPEWSTLANHNADIKWIGAKTMEVAKDLKLHFVPITSSYHLTNYKPDFMLQLLQGPAAGANSIFYFDPDVVVSRPWSMFTEWINCGVALCEDINSPLPQYHPRRIAWRTYFEKYGMCLKFKESFYANGGFIGVKLANVGFLTLWKRIQEAMSYEIGGLQNSMFRNAKLLETVGGAFSPFAKTDQDALNATIEAYTDQISFVSKDGMGFIPGIQLMHHALGTPKPWHWKPISQALAGKSPRHVDRLYWQSVGGPIAVNSKFKIQQHNVAMQIAAAIGRFYSKSN